METKTFIINQMPIDLIIELKTIAAQRSITLNKLVPAIIKMGIEQFRKNQELDLD